MPKFKLDPDLSEKFSRAKAVHIQTERNQHLASKENRPAKWLRQMQSRSERFSLPWLTAHPVKKQRKPGVVGRLLRKAVTR